MLKVNAKIDDKFYEVMINLNYVQIIMIINNEVQDTRTIEYLVAHQLVANQNEIRAIIVADSLEYLTTELRKSDEERWGIVKHDAAIGD
jgi:hypothetical protein